MELNDIFKKSDYVVTIVPLNPETYHMIGKEQFDQTLMENTKTQNLTSKGLKK